MVAERAERAFGNSIRYRKQYQIQEKVSDTRDTVGSVTAIAIRIRTIAIIILIKIAYLPIPNSTSFNI
jgi:hypothetical protein